MAVSTPANQRVSGLAPRRNAFDPESGARVSALSVSFEFFPPTDPEMERTLWNTVDRLAALTPSFVSVTHGADGSTRGRTREVVERLRSETSLNVAPHVTSIGSSRAEILELARHYWAIGIRHLVALRGDVPASVERTAGSCDAFQWGLDLVKGLRSVADFEISVAAYPEVHPEARSAREDFDNLKRKIDAGARRALTQFFFDNSAYLRFRDACVVAGIQAPIVPGILPIMRFSQVERFARRCGAAIPGWIRRRFEGLDDDAETRRLPGAAVALEQVLHLQRNGVNEFHFYTLNRADLTYAICHALGVRESSIRANPIDEAGCDSRGASALE
jgi:methylenetetrahydrofolate reductase (NADPH)